MNLNLDMNPAKFVEQNAAPLAIITVLIVGGAVGLSQAGFDIPGMQASISGSQLCAIGADQVRVSSNDPDIGGKTWIVEAVGGCSDHVIEGGALVEADDIQGQDPDTGETAKAREDFEIGLTDFQGYAYNNVRDPDALSTYTVEHRRIEGSGVGGGIVKPDLQACREWQEENSVSLDALDQPEIDPGDDQFSNTDHVPYVQEGLPFVDGSVLNCYRAQAKEGEIGYFESTTFSDWTGTFAMQAGGTTVDKTVTKEQAQGGITLGTGDQQAHIQYTGSLTNRILDTNLDTNRFRPACDNNCNQPENQKSYKITADTLVDDYVSSIQNFEYQSEQAVENGNPGSVATSHNTDVQNIYTGQSQALQNEVGNWVSRTEFQGDQFRVYGEDNDILGRPSFTFKIDADWIGFEIPVADPEIGSVSDVSLEAQGPGSSTRITLQNNAEVGGTVHTSVSCPSPLIAGYDEGYIQPGGTQSFNVDISSGPSPDNTYTCDVRVKDKDARQVQDTSTLSVDVASSCTDTDGDGVCDQNDGCIDEEGPASNNGCPTGPQDSDGDGIADSQDQCPTRSQTPDELLDRFGTSQEIYNGYQDSDGCPDEIQNPNEEVQCNDGIDNDGDGLIDDADPDCQDTNGSPVLPIALGAIILAGGVAAYYYRKPLQEKLSQWGAGR